MGLGQELEGGGKKHELYASRCVNSLGQTDIITFSLHSGSSRLCKCFVALPNETWSLSLHSLESVMNLMNRMWQKGYCVSLRLGLMRRCSFSCPRRTLEPLGCAGTQSCLLLDGRPHGGNQRWLIRQHQLADIEWAILDPPAQPTP